VPVTSSGRPKTASAEELDSEKGKLDAGLMDGLVSQRLVDHTPRSEMGYCGRFVYFAVGRYGVGHDGRKRDMKSHSES